MLRAHAGRAAGGTWLWWGRWLQQAGGPASVHSKHSRPQFELQHCVARDECHAHVAAWRVGYVVLAWG